MVKPQGERVGTWLARSYFPLDTSRLANHGGFAAAALVGAAFGLGWTPCIGPVLGAVLGFAAHGQDLARATALLVAYSLGLGLSFLVVGLGLAKLATPLDWVKRHSRAITLASAAILFFFGVVLLTDNLSQVTAKLTNLASG